MRQRGKERSCAVCRKKAPKEELLRFVRSGGAQGEIRFDFDQLLPGRGAYCCKSRACIESVRGAASMLRSLRRDARPRKGGEKAGPDGTGTLDQSIREVLAGLAGRELKSPRRAKRKLDLEMVLGSKDASRALTLKKRKYF